MAQLRATPAGRPAWSCRPGQLLDVGSAKRSPSGMPSLGTGTTSSPTRTATPSTSRAGPEAATPRNCRPTGAIKNQSDRAQPTRRASASGVLMSTQPSFTVEYPDPVGEVAEPLPDEFSPSRLRRSLVLQRRLHRRGQHDQGRATLDPGGRERAGGHGATEVPEHHARRPGRRDRAADRPARRVISQRSQR